MTTSKKQRVFIIAILVLISFYMILQKSNTSCSIYVIDDIGGCDNKGLCRIRSDDGHEHFVRYPIKGQVVRSCH